MQSAAQHLLEDAGEHGSRLVLSGQLVLAAIGPIERDLRHTEGSVTSVDLAGVDEIDTVGA
jgi:phospholipid/cholesterol/gamma-HCH transport system permease protein